jgi:hypothetical protein
LVPSPTIACAELTATPVPAAVLQVIENDPVVPLITTHSPTMFGKIKFKFAVSNPVITMTGLPYCNSVKVTLAPVIVMAAAPFGQAPFIQEGNTNAAN